MKYSDIRSDMKSGDVLLVKAAGIISRIIRAVTGESINHAAMVITNVSGVWIIEMKEWHGMRLMPASQWMDEQSKNIVLWGKAPEPIRDSLCIEIEAMSRRGEPYSYLTLITVWIGQFTKKRHRGQLVCSTFVQTVWSECGFEMSTRLADPGDFMEVAEDINHITL